MKFVDEFRDPAAARALLARITELAGDDQFKFMEVCGGHTHTIYRHAGECVSAALDELLGDLDGIERRALAQVVADDEQDQPLTAWYRLVLADPPDEHLVAAGRVQRGRVVVER